MRVLAAMALAALMLAGGCARAPTRPDWVAGNSVKYPARDFMIGRGQAASQTEAADRARAELAKLFQVAISAESSDTESFQRSSVGRAVHSEQRWQVTRSVGSVTDQVLEGVQIADLWQDPKTGLYHALAVLSRAQSSARLRTQIAQLDQATAEYRTQARADRDPLDRVGAASRALDAQQQRQSLQQALTIVDGSGQGVPTPWPVAQLRTELDDLLKQVHVAAEVKSDPLGGLAAALAGGLAVAGFTVTNEASAQYVARATLALDDLGRQEGWYWLRAMLEIELADNPGGHVRGVKRWAIKSSASDIEGARSRVRDQLVTVLRRDLRATVIGFAAGP
jgi:hypothetical protein